MTERDAFEARFHGAVRGYAARVSSDLDPVGLARTIAAAEPRRRGVAGVLASRGLAVWRLAWILLLLAALLTVTVSAAIVGSGLLRRGPDLSVVPPPTVPSVPSAAPMPSAGLPGEPAVVAISTDELRDVAIAGDGSAWATTGLGVVHWDLATGRATLFDTADGLDEPGDGILTGADQIAIAPDGSVWATSDRWVAHFDGTWTTFPGFSAVRWLEIARDGTVWVADASDLRRFLRRFDGAWTTIPLPEGVGEVLGLSIAPDGPVVARDLGVILHYDGAAWTTYPNQGLPVEPELAGVADDGSVWVNLGAVECSSSNWGATCPIPAGVARYDGARWTVYTAANGLAACDDCQHPSVEVGPDGTVWARYGNAGVISRFDGARWTTATVPELDQAAFVTFGRDGALWFASGGGLLRYDGTAVSRPAYRLPGIDATRSVATLRPALVAGPTVTHSALGTITWRVYAVDTDYGRVPVGSTHGLVMLDGPARLRWLTPDGSWPGTFLPIDATRVQAVGDGLVAFGATDAVRLSWDGARWVPGEHLELPQGLAVTAFVAGPRSTVAVGQASDGSGAFAFSADGVHFAMAARPPDGTLGDSIASVLATKDGFVGLVPTRDVQPALGDPLAWTSVDGSTWTRAAETSPFGTGSEITSIASRDGRHVAVGSDGQSRSTVWVSDDGLRWDRVASLAPDRSVVVAAGAAGWMIVGWQGGAWVSTDGRAWEELQGWTALSPRGVYEVPQVVEFSATTVAVRGSLRGEAGSVDAIAIGTIEP
jgi:hypothetical protein